MRAAAGACIWQELNPLRLSGAPWNVWIQASLLYEAGS